MDMYNCICWYIFKQTIKNKHCTLNCYSLSKKSWPILYIKLLNKFGQDFLNIQFLLLLSKIIRILPTPATSCTHRWNWISFDSRLTLIQIIFLQNFRMMHLSKKNVALNCYCICNFQLWFFLSIKLILKQILIYILNKIFY